MRSMLNFLAAIENLVLTYLLETNLDLLDQILTLVLVSFTTFYILGKASIKKNPISCRHVRKLLSPPARRHRKTGFSRHFCKFFWVYIKMVLNIMIDKSQFCNK